MLLWRVSNHAELDGLGGLVASARWHYRGHRVVYLAETPAGAFLEVLVHLELDFGNVPKTYQMLKVEARDNLASRAIDVAAIPPDWATNEQLTRKIGTEWLSKRETALLRVPSAVVPETSNVLLNPLHPDAEQLKVLWHRSFPWDARLPHRK